jgi:hypothetical protein
VEHETLKPTQGHPRENSSVAIKYYFRTQSAAIKPINILNREDISAVKIININ